MSERDLLPVLAGLSRPRILIVGDLILDRYVSGEVRRISPEAPIPVLAARHTDERLGGAGNVAANLRAMETEVELIGLMGDDAPGKSLLELLDDIGVETRFCVRDGSRPTIEKTRLTSGVQQMLRVDWEEPRPIAVAYEQQLLGKLAECVPAASAVILSDYGKGLCTPAVLAEVIRLARDGGIPVLVDPKGSDYTRYRGATLVTPNRKEAEEALGRRIERLDELPDAARDLIAAAELQAAVITLGSEGIFHLSADGTSARVPTVARAVFDVTGAGDTVIAHLALALAAGLDLAQAVRLANQAAGIVVGRRGAASVTRAELRAALGGPHQRGTVLQPSELDSVLAEWRAEGKRIVFTNGCFDILHAGHIDYLRTAKNKGDVLLVGVNDDASVRRLKGESRPINPLADRLLVLAALEMVDGVVPFSEDTPAAIVERVTPDVLVKGEDWAEKGVVGREHVERHGGEVYLAPLVPGRSSTSVIDRVRAIVRCQDKTTRSPANPAVTPPPAE